MNSQCSDRPTAEAKGYMTEMLWNQAYDIFKELKDDYGQSKSDNLFRDNRSNGLEFHDPNYGNLDIILDSLSPHSSINEGQDYANPPEEYLRSFVRVMESNNVDSYEDFRDTVLSIDEVKNEEEKVIENFVQGQFLKTLWETEFDISTD